MSELNDLLNRRVAVRFGTGEPYVEGIVVGIYHSPTLIVENDNGSHVTVSTDLPRTVIDRRKVRA